MYRLIFHLGLGDVVSSAACQVPTVRETQVPFTIITHKDVCTSRDGTVCEVCDGFGPVGVAFPECCGGGPKNDRRGNIYRGSGGGGSGGFRTAGALGWMTGKKSRSMGQSATRCHRMPPYTPSSGKLSANNIICPSRP